MAEAPNIVAKEQLDELYVCNTVEDDNLVASYFDTLI